MPIYEFYCGRCHTIYNFFSRSINTTATPDCPRCRKATMTRQVSLFAITGRASEDADLDDLPVDEGKIEQAMQMLARDADKVDEDDPRQAAQLMRKLTDMTGLELGGGMQEALARMERGEDPEKIEAELGDLLETEEPFIMPGKGGLRGGTRTRPPRRDDTLYDLEP